MSNLKVFINVSFASKIPTVNRHGYWHRSWHQLCIILLCCSLLSGIQIWNLYSSKLLHIWAAFTLWLLFALLQNKKKTKKNFCYDHIANIWLFKPADNYFQLKLANWNFSLIPVGEDVPYLQFKLWNSFFFGYSIHKRISFLICHSQFWSIFLW